MSNNLNRRFDDPAPLPKVLLRLLYAAFLVGMTVFGIWFSVAVIFSLHEVLVDGSPPIHHTRIMNTRANSGARE